MLRWECQRGHAFGWTAASAEAAAGTAAEEFFSEMPPWFRWKCILWAPKAELQNVSSEFWSDQAAKAEAAAVKLSRRSVRHVADGGLVPLEVSVRGEAADAFAADFARELLRAYPNIQEEDVEVMCDEALVALPQGGFGGMGCSTGVQAGLTARHPRKRMAALRLPRVKVTGAEGGWRTRPRYLQKKGQQPKGEEAKKQKEEEQKRKEEEQTQKEEEEQTRKEEKQKEEEEQKRKAEEQRGKEEKQKEEEQKRREDEQKRKEEEQQRKEEEQQKRMRKEEEEQKRKRKEEEQKRKRKEEERSISASGRRKRRRRRRRARPSPTCWRRS